MRTRIFEPIRTVSGITWTLFGLYSVVVAVSMELYLRTRPAAGMLVDDIHTGPVLLMITWACSFLMMLLSSPRVYRIVMSIRVALTLVLLLYATKDMQITTLVIAVLVGEICLYDPFPLNLFIGLAVVACSAVTRLTALVYVYGQPWGDSIEMQATLVIVGLLVVIGSSLLVRWREGLAESQRQEARLEGMVTTLTKANFQSQDFANQAKEIAMDDERKRITRDIHDVVGYTLTNNIMMMEAAIDMMQRNPSGVQALINVARDNAQEGLERIRESMYKLRSKTIVHPTGLRAVLRLLSVYQRATGVHVDSHFTKVHWGYSDEIDSAIYHLVQETLMNSFRHGKADTVRLVIDEDQDGIHILIRDNGIGSNGFVEGIGLKGIRERVSRLAGDVKAGSSVDGFVVRVTIPLGKRDL